MKTLSHFALLSPNTLATLKALTHPTFITIYQRMLNSFTPRIDLLKFIDFEHSFSKYGGTSVIAKATTLDGIEFKPRSSPSLQSALRLAQSSTGEPAFAHLEAEQAHWAWRASFAETIGTGFREVQRLKLSDRPLRCSSNRPTLNGPSSDLNFNKHFNMKPIKMVEVSSLHCGIGKNRCNIHIDQTGFTMQIAGNTSVNPDTAQHFFNELIWKTYGLKVFPRWLVDNVNFIFPDSANGYARRIGINAEYKPATHVTLTANASCSIGSCAGDWSVTGGLRLNF